MPVLTTEILTEFARAIFAASSVADATAQIVAQSLVLSNLKGHDSHGVMRVLEYVDWLERGWIDAKARLEIVRDRGAILSVDGHFGFGQVVGREATELAIAKTKKEGVCILTIRRSAHLGRIGEWMEMGAAAGLVCFSFTNTHGGGVLVAPHGGRERRLSANPLGGGAPLPDGSMMIMDMATSTIAEGKIKVAREKGEPLPPDCIVNGHGEPSTNAAEYYANPPGALLPFGGHKGYALSMFAEVFAGALSGGGCSKPGTNRVANTLFAIFAEPREFCDDTFYREEIGGLIQFVKSSHLMKGFAEILLPGEPEQRAVADRSRNGIAIPEATWGRLTALAKGLNVAVPSFFP